MQNRFFSYNSKGVIPPLIPPVIAPQQFALLNCKTHYLTIYCLHLRLWNVHETSAKQEWRQEKSKKAHAILGKTKLDSEYLFIYL